MLNRSAVATVALTLLLSARPASPQEPPAPRAGGISGTVVDAESLRPLAGVTIELEAQAAAALPGAQGRAFLEGGRVAISDERGGYRFEGLPAGRYLLRIARIGYRSATVGVELRGATDSRVSIGLTVEPVALEPVDVRVPPTNEYGRNRTPESDEAGARVSAARSRQEEHLASDVREMTHADVVESVTLGETDLFRAFQRVAGVSARDDYGAELWVRGAPWDQTRIVFDGVPLFNPVHGFGLLSALNTDAVGGALLHPGVRSAALGDGAAALLDVTSRTGRAGSLNGTAELSLASGRVALDGGTRDARAAWMVAARRSWLDLVAAAAAKVTGNARDRLPYAFEDVTGRLDVAVDDERTIEASALHERDRITGTIPDIVHRTRAGWGNTAGRVTYASPLGRLRSRATVGVSTYDARVRAAEPDSAAEGGLDAPDEPPSDNRLVHLSLAGELFPTRSGARVLPWRMGYGVVWQRAVYEGPEGYSYNGFRPMDADSSLVRRTTLPFGTLWGETRWDVGPQLTLETGLRVEAGRSVRNGGAVRLMPRLTTRWAATPDLSFSAGAGRTFQYAQALAGTGPSVGAGYAASHLWLLADEEVPAIRADVATAGAELWLGGSWLLAANGYVRRSTGVTLPDPTPGPLVDRPLFVTGASSARGVELSARRLAGRWTASGSYSLGVARMTAAGITFPTSEDRRHALDLTSMVRARGTLRVGAAFTYASGAPYTRVHIRSLPCTPTICGYEIVAEAKNVQRGPSYASLDLLLDWTRRMRRWDLGLFLQVRNALGRRNAVTLSDSSVSCTPRMPNDPLCAQVTFNDQFQQGLPTLPVFGARARF